MTPTFASRFHLNAQMPSQQRHGRLCLRRNLARRRQDQHLHFALLDIHHLQRHHANERAFPRSRLRLCDHVSLLQYRHHCSLLDARRLLESSRVHAPQQLRLEPHFLFHASSATLPRSQPLHTAPHLKGLEHFQLGARKLLVLELQQLALVRGRLGTPLPVARPRSLTPRRVPSRHYKTSKPVKRREGLVRRCDCCSPACDDCRRGP